VEFHETIKIVFVVEYQGSTPLEVAHMTAPVKHLELFYEIHCKDFLIKKRQEGVGHYKLLIDLMGLRVALVQLLLIKPVVVGLYRTRLQKMGKKNRQNLQNLLKLPKIQFCCLISLPLSHSVQKCLQLVLLFLQPAHSNLSRYFCLVFLDREQLIAIKQEEQGLGFHCSDHG
jgi:hypothetical protein